MLWVKDSNERRVRFALENRSRPNLPPPDPHPQVPSESPPDPPPPPIPPTGVGIITSKEPLPKRVEHPDSGQCYGYGPNILDKVTLTDRFREERKSNIFYPFSCEEDMQMGFWIARQNISINQMENFFKNKYIRNRPLSFASAAQLIDRIEVLPKTPSWKCCEVAVEGGRTKKPIKFFHRDAWECFCFLFGNPIFDGHMRLSPNLVGVGETLGLVMLASDEALLTNHYGDKCTYGVYLSCGNIAKDIRGGLSSKCWMKVAEIPVVQFEDKQHQTLLHDRLAHKCLDIVTSQLKYHSHNPTYVPDPSGRIRLLRPILCAHLGDTKEQKRTACVAENSSPVSIANFRQLGLSTACQPRTAEFTLRRIRNLDAAIGDNRSDLAMVRATASSLHLNGVMEPYWRDWKFAEPSIFITPDILHQMHGFFMDHPMEWARKLLTDKELDKRVTVLQRRIGFRTFLNGFTRFKQHTGREERDLQRAFIAIIAGHPTITPNVIRAFRGLLDYIYTAQYDTQSTETLKFLRKCLRTFHRNKGYISRTGVRDGSRMKGKFKIPKLELLHQAPRIIKEIGSAPQFSTDYSEHLHIGNAKVPYTKTNRKEYEGQICRYLDRRDKMDFFEIATHQNRLRQLRLFKEFMAKTGKYMPKPDIDYFTPLPPNSARTLLRNDTTAFGLTARITYRKRTIDAVSEIYHLPHLLGAILSFYGVRDLHELPFGEIDCWDKVRIQLHKCQDQNTIVPPYTVAAFAPSDALPFGFCNFVLVKLPIDHPYRGIQSPQLRMIFRPFIRRGAKVYLAYVQPLKPANGTISCQDDGHLDHVPDDNIEMFRFVRDLRPDGSRRGRVVQLLDIWRPIDVIPKFEEQCPEEWTRDNSVELATEFYANSFADKETYQSVY
ncbi:hypothetical protein SCHPADRAFT_836422 [Schizopora paradoxa]|uniref:DUF6830 domain-containing protein n=1 Tax=Schizopora paradoxa TaxID=27342 RepID=A0A0H2RDJ4_9AGAM|nr:hypothetical protein SCHPADRAFT_840666 [Schizopora paradoxa]KLO07593.1 hypothetical protein SCHPADRAFT_836422 [Schizopora paradoxa]